MPRDILEKEAILDLVSAGYVVIAGGGGGIPTVRKDNWYRAIDAVIDKDYVSVMLAADARCDTLAILTGVEITSLDKPVTRTPGRSKTRLSMVVPIMGGSRIGDRRSLRTDGPPMRPTHTPR